MDTVYYDRFTMLICFISSNKLMISIFQIIFWPLGNVTRIITLRIWEMAIRFTRSLVGRGSICKSGDCLYIANKRSLTFIDYGWKSLEYKSTTFSSGQYTISINYT
jgi:hypothetical protein